MGGTHDIPIESIRLKRIRDGREAYEYLHLLDQRGEGSEAMSVVQGLFGSLNSATHNTTVSQGQPQMARAQLVGLITGSAPDVAEPTPPNSVGNPSDGKLDWRRRSASGCAARHHREGPERPNPPCEGSPSVKRLSRVGVRALVRCTSPAAGSISTSTVNPRAVHRLGLPTSRIGRGHAEIAPLHARWVRAHLSHRVRHRLIRGKTVGTIHIRTSIETRPIAS